MNTAATQTQYRPGDTITALDYDGREYSFTLTDAYYITEWSGALIDYVEAEYEEGHGTEFAVHLRADSIASFLKFDGIELESPIYTTDTAELGDR